MVVEEELLEWVELALRLRGCGFVLEDEAIVGCSSEVDEEAQKESGQAIAVWSYGM